MINPLPQLIKPVKGSAVILLFFITFSCRFPYSFTGANISPEVKTFSVDYFQNRARLVNPQLSQQFTEGLRDKIQHQTSLKEITDAGDLEFSGQIDGYEVRPVAIQKEDLAAQNRLTISIRVKFINNKDHDQDFDRSFSSYEDFSSSLSLSDIEGSLVPEIIKKLTEDIFNASVANW